MPTPTPTRGRWKTGERKEEEEEDCCCFHWKSSRARKSSFAEGDIYVYNLIRWTMDNLYGRICS